MHDVAIIGYGPVGATLAGLLGRLGLDVVVTHHVSLPGRPQHEALARIDRGWEFPGPPPCRLRTSYARCVAEDNHPP